MGKIDTKPLLEKIGKPISGLALGTAFFRNEREGEWFELLDAFVDAGGTLIDSGRIYGDSEEVLGSWLESRGLRDRVVLITKCAHGEGIIPEEGYSELVKQELTTSLRMLRMDFVDLYMLHRDNQEMPVGDILEPLNEEIARGRVQVIGASNWEYRRLSEANEYAEKRGLQGFAVVSNNISLARPAAAFYPGLVSIDSEGERWHRETGIPLIPWSSQARGFFNGEYTREMAEDATLVSPPEKTLLSRMLKVYGTDENFTRLERARDLGEKKGYTAVEVALAWLLHKPFSLVPIVGSQNPGELASCIRATELSLNREEIEWLNLER
jgi:1-deoxyxylulose-5-phosphate synthase